MPNPKRYKNKDKYMSDCMHQTVDVENKSKDQGLAICLNMWREKKAMIPISETIRYRACVLAELDRDAGVRDLLKNMKNFLDEAMSQADERARIEDYLKKNPQSQRALEEMFEIAQSPSPAMK